MKNLAAGALIAFAAAASTTPAEAHRLKVFATVEGSSIAGYAFFIGGGRAQGSSWLARDAQGGEIASGATDDNGRFAFAVPGRVVSDITVTVDTHEAHVASAIVAANRFAGAAIIPAPATPAAGTPAARTPPLADPQLAALVETAVQRQVEPLLERIEEMDSRLRFVDILSGLFFIVGLAGMALWFRAGRRDGPR